ncbi:MAG: PAS domain-containing protein [Bacillaceae bacterium]|nr:PAS domain-containing protein [Bacillaceae bacterium]
MDKSTIRPFVMYFIIIILVMGIIGLIIGQLSKQYVTGSIKDRLEKEGAYVIEVLDQEAPPFEETVETISTELELGVRLYSENTEIILDTVPQILHVSDEEMDEIERAISEDHLEWQEEEGFLLINDFYLSAMRVQTTGFSGILLLIVSAENSSQVMNTIWVLIFSVMAVTALIMLFLGVNILDKYVKPVRAAAHTARELADGNYNARIYEGHYGDAGELSHAINLLARNLQEMTLQSKIQNNRLQAVVDSMGSGLMLIDEKGYINLVNKAFLDSFSGKTSDYIGYLYYEALSYEEIHDVVKDVFMTENHVQKTIVVSKGIERRFFAIFGAPIFNERNVWKGTVLVFHDITEMKRLEEIRKDFVANVSHELKTPITSIKGFAETLLEGAKDDPKLLDEFLTIIYKESRRMQQLIKDLLELSKLEHDEFDLHIETISVRNIVKDVLSLVDYLANEKQIEIHNQIDKDLYFDGDSSRIKQVLLNLLTNAISYTPEKGTVTVDAEENQEELVLMVKDTGIGIPEEDLPRIFERFYRVDKARSRNSGGTGLGLAIVKHIVEAHHGRIEVNSEINKGTVFYIYLKKNFTKY